VLSNVNVLVRCPLTRASDAPRNNLVIERVDLRWDRCAIRRAPCSFMPTPTQSQTGELEKVLRVRTSLFATLIDASPRGSVARIRAARASNSERRTRTMRSASARDAVDRAGRETVSCQLPKKWH